jgi:hypothetical protein
LLGEVQVVDQLAEILMDADFKYYQKGRVVRALGHICTEEAVGATKKFHSDALIGAVPVGAVWDVMYPGGHVFHDMVWFGSPVGFEISAAFALSGDTCPGCVEGK